MTREDYSPAACVLLVVAGLVLLVGGAILETCTTEASPPGSDRVSCSVIHPLGEPCCWEQPEHERCQDGLLGAPSWSFDIETAEPDDNTLVWLYPGESPFAAEWPSVMGRIGDWCSLLALAWIASAEPPVYCRDGDECEAALAPDSPRAAIVRELLAAVRRLADATRADYVPGELSAAVLDLWLYPVEGEAVEIRRRVP